VSVLARLAMLPRLLACVGASLVFGTATAHVVHDRAEAEQLSSVEIRRDDTASSTSDSLYEGESRVASEVGESADVHNASENDPPGHLGLDAEERRLQLPPSLPIVTGLDFFDTDLDDGNIGGSVVWTPIVSRYVTAYEVYLTDSAGSHTSYWPWGNTYLGSVLYGNNSLAIKNTTLGAFTHIYVHTRSLLGVNPDGAKVEVCDVKGEDTLALVSADATTAPWGIVEVTFHSDPGCSDAAMRWAAVVATSNDGNAEKAMDGKTTTAWRSACSTCAAGIEKLKILGVCRPEEVRCVKVFQCKGDGTFGCELGSSTSRTSALRLEMNGQEVFTWRSLIGFPTLREEHLTVSGRRRRASFNTYESTATLERTTSCLNNPPTFACTASPR